MKPSNQRRKQEARVITYAHWYKTRVIDQTMMEVARELSLPLEALATSFGLGWHPDVTATEFDFTDNQPKKLMKTLEKCCWRGAFARHCDVPCEVCYWSSGHLDKCSCVLRPDCGFHTYMVLSHGQHRSLVRWGHILFVHDKQDYTAQLQRLCTSLLRDWVYSSLIYAWILFVQVDKVQPLQ